MYVSLFAQELPSSANWGAGGWTRAGAIVATPYDLDSLQSNPAGLMRYQKQSSVGGSYNKLPLNLDEWSAGVVDGRTAVIGAFSFDWLERGDIIRKAYNIGAAYNTTYGAAGFAANFYNFEGMNRYNGWHLSQTTGILVPVAYGINIAAAAKSFLDNEPDTLLPPQFSTGVSFTKEGILIFSFQADRRFEIPSQDWNYSFGGDLLFKDFYAIRGGYRIDNSKETDIWSVGLVMTAPRFEIFGFYTQASDIADDDGFGLSAAFLF
ncbi:MAG: hypothetical protein COV44_04120 [Deltaproteobacteria bacterium CG11_big_fil_rev_8_21_14_0_20_45_16]|nr:MAG: hypothetical protein COV44_04120 [Deltaproteobacteria bacterium CG11_big_fil_rev_8_21_14_0_20_45_16]